MENINSTLFVKGATIETILGPIKFSIVEGCYRVNYVNDGEIYETTSLERAITDVKTRLRCYGAFRR